MFIKFNMLFVFLIAKLLILTSPVHASESSASRLSPLVASPVSPMVAGMGLEEASASFGKNGFSSSSTVHSVSWINTTSLTRMYRSSSSYAAWLAHDTSQILHSWWRTKPLQATLSSLLVIDLLFGIVVNPLFFALSPNAGYVLPLVSNHLVTNLLKTYTILPTQGVATLANSMAPILQVMLVQALSCTQLLHLSAVGLHNLIFTGVRFYELYQFIHPVLNVGQNLGQVLGGSPTPNQEPHRAAAEAALRRWSETRAN